MASKTAAIVTIGTSCLTRDLVWCECGRGLSLSGKWRFCPSCGRELEQQSYEIAVGKALRNGANLYVNSDFDQALLLADKLIRNQAEQIETLKIQLAVYARALED